MEQYRNIVLICLVGCLNSFVMKELKIDNDVFHQLSSCDRRSERIGRFAVAKQLGPLLSLNEARSFLEGEATKQTSIAIESGEIKDEYDLPGASIDTGHSCAWRAKAKHGKIRTKMTKEVQKLKFEVFDDDYDSALDKYRQGHPSEFPSIAEGIVAAEAHLSTEIEVRKEILCRKIWQKTCQSHAIAYGDIGVTVELLASGFEIKSHPGKLCFNVDYQATVYSNETFWRPFHVSNSESCNLLQVFGLTLSSMNGRIDHYANTYVKQDSVRKINSTRLTDAMERVLEARMGSLVCLDLVQENGAPFKQPAGFSKSASSTCPRQCPDDYVLLSSQGVCQKSFGRNKTTCPSGSYLYQKKRGRSTYYYCRINV
eukprot:GFUD01106638.1.p1 GENE.GFUD01106638.1~~GFUD01106638.1.p1  ORF type:complete len:381 (+),score=54.35 GFUD01106638.1:34-1143(+)